MPAAGEAIIALSTLLLWTVVLGLLYAYRATLGAILLALAHKMDDTHLPGFRGHGPSLGRIGDALRSVDSAIRSNLEQAARALESYAAYFLHALWNLFYGLGAWTEDFSHTVEGAFSNVFRHAIPDAETRVYRQAKREAGVIAGAVAQTATVALPGIRSDVNVLGGKVRVLDRELDALRARIRAHAKLLTGAGIVGLTMIALRRMGLGWLRCGNVRKFGKRLCGLDPSMLDTLLLGTAFIAGAISVERITRELLEQEEFVIAALQRGFTELRGIPSK